jgi:hypothetical protein
MYNLFELIELRCDTEKIAYPVFSVSTHQQGFFSALALAECAINHIVKTAQENGSSDSIYCFFVRKFRVDIFPSDKNVMEERAYSASGELIDEFENGDIVEMLCDNHIELGIVAIVYGLGFVQDFHSKYMVLSGKYWCIEENLKSLYDRRIDQDDFDFENYPSDAHVFSPRLPVPEELKEALKNYLDDYRCYEIEAFISTRISKKESQLPVTVWVDDVGIWDKMIAFNKDTSEDLDFKNKIFMTIEDGQKILDENVKHDLTDDELLQIKEFLKKYKKILLYMNEKKATCIDLHEEIRKNRTRT